MENPLSVLGLAAYLAPYLYGRAAGQTANDSQAVATRGVEYGPPASAAVPPTASENLPTPPPFAPRPTAGRPPVATPGAPQANVDSATNPADAAAQTMRNLQATSGAGQEREGRDAGERLANFGFAMAASRNPSLFGMIGEAGLALQRGNREDRQDTRQEREVDVMAEYRRAQIDLGRAEAEWNRDPNNPLNVARLAEARYRLAAAANAGRSGSGSADRIAGQVVGDDGILYGTTRDGRVVPYRTPEGEPFRRGETERVQTLWNSARTEALRRMSDISSPERMLSPEERERRANAEAARAVAGYRALQGQRGGGGGAGATTGAGTGGEQPARVIDLQRPR